MSTLEIKGLVASVAGKQILNGIDLVVRSGEVRLGIFDDGRGFDMRKVSRERLGFSIMHARAAEIGAQLTIDSEPGMGTHLFFSWKDIA